MKYKLRKLLHLRNKYSESFFSTRLLLRLGMDADNKEPK